GPSGAVVGVDPNPGMLAVAEELNGAVEWQKGTAEELPFPDASFDAVVSQFGLMFFSDPSAAAREMGRVLCPSGALAVAVWDALENSPAYALEVELLDRLAGPAAADALRAPFALGDGDELAALFEDAGLSSVEVLTGTGRARFPSVRVMVEADLRGWLPVMGVELSDEKIEEILTEAEAVLAPFVTDAGRAEFDQPAHIVVGLRGAEGEDGAT
nr:methyltransferase domain-containing protein [Gemmatimonadota bacterium]NIR80311.1 methyltransferase domain-containing protein [Gemmatimonadota bacterium]NIT89074.1 methyltransferase domain-containing protein [Gemmatimonadota bacterium]NIU32871.1 methyltransferase domain-containing protein [Gemmatimonadota bacterium]NIU37277.1 methyltransferase domain-containing protein [Gemmatimonadota bacterium]